MFKGWRHTQPVLAERVSRRVVADFRGALNNEEAFKEGMARVLDALKVKRDPKGKIDWTSRSVKTLVASTLGRLPAAPPSARSERVRLMTPDPVTIYLGTALAERATELFGKRVIGRWADYRARQFVKQFVAEVTDTSPGSTKDEEIERKLTEIVEDDAKSAALFDAFRHVARSASREIGPRVLALHIAEVVSGLVEDEEVSDAVMLAASSLLDPEFEELVRYATANDIKGASFAESLHVVSLLIYTDSIRSDSIFKSASTGPLPLRTSIGSWAQKLEQIGLVIQTVSEDQRDYHPPNSVEPISTREFRWTLELREGFSHLFRLTRRVIEARESER